MKKEAEIAGTLVEQISPALRRTFDTGKFWHDYLGAILLDMKFVDPKNVEKYILQKITVGDKFFYGSGIADLVDVRIPGHGKWLIDIKTMNKAKFDQGADSQTMLKWIAQLSCYADWFKRDNLMVLAVSKDSPHAMKEYVIRKDENLLNEIYSRWLAVSLEFDVK